MTKKEIYSKVHEILLNRRNDAVMVAEKNKEIANRDGAYLELCSKERVLNMEIGRAKFEQKDASQFEKELESIMSKKKARLAELGFDEKDLLPNYVCKKCGDTGVFENKVCSCASQLASNIMMQTSGVDLNDVPNLIDYDYKFFDDKNEKTFAKKCVQKLEDYVKNFDAIQIKNIVMSGASGTGKTYLSKCLAKTLIQKNYTTFFVSAFDLNNIFLDEHLSQSDESNKLRDLTNFDCLIIDDLGTEPMRKNVTKEYLLLLLNERLEKGKATIITTNLGPLDVLEKYQERLFSRMLDQRNTLILTFDGKNVRLKK